MVSVYLWFTFGWMLWGRFESEHHAKMFVAKYPNKQWKITNRQHNDNFIPPSHRHSKPEQSGDFAE